MNQLVMELVKILLNHRNREIRIQTVGMFTKMMKNKQIVEIVVKVNGNLLEKLNIMFAQDINRIRKEVFYCFSNIARHSTH